MNHRLIEYHRFYWFCLTNKTECRLLRHQYQLSEQFKNSYFEEYLWTAPSGRSIQQKIVVAWKYFRKTFWIFEGFEYATDYEYVWIPNYEYVWVSFNTKCLFVGLVRLISNHMFGSGNFWDKSPSWFLKTLKSSLFYSDNFKIFKSALGNLSQIAIPNMWLLVLMMGQATLVFEMEFKQLISNLC